MSSSFWPLYGLGSERAFCGSYAYAFPVRKMAALMSTPFGYSEPYRTLENPVW